jgi:hypothetical protein
MALERLKSDLRLVGELAAEHIRFIKDLALVLLAIVVFFTATIGSPFGSGGGGLLNGSSEKRTKRSHRGV